MRRESFKQARGSDMNSSTTNQINFNIKLGNLREGTWPVNLIFFLRLGSII